MKNRIKFIIIFTFFIIFNYKNIVIAEEFNFNITEVEILNEGNLFKGLKRGTATTKEGLEITADEFEYDKLLNILKAEGNVEIKDNIKDYTIFSKSITYLKNQEKIFTLGKTNALINSKYNFETEDIILLRNSMKLNSDRKTKIIDDEFTTYELDKFEYQINEKILKGINIDITTNSNLSETSRDKYNFKDGIFNLESKDFLASETKIKIRKDSFEDNRNDPRIYGVSSKKTGNITVLDKAIFTSCGFNDKCPPWSIKAEKIIHDKNQKKIIYDNSVLKIYDIPVFYFPKFFHPDPTVKRQSGLLQPRLNNSNILGSSLSVPYYKVIATNKDITFKPTFFDSDIYMFQNEYRQENRKSSLIADLGLTKGYSSSNQKNKKNSIGHFFSKFDFDLGLSSFSNSNLKITLQKITMDTYLKVFEANLVSIDPKIKPEDQDNLVSNLTLDLKNENFTMDMGMTSYEKLDGSESDRYQYILPYYNFYKNSSNTKYGILNFSSKGNNNLKDTNNLKTSINNDLSLKTFDYVSDFGVKSNLGFHFKNVNTSAKNDSVYKSSLQSELMGIINFEGSLPLIKETERYFNSLTPKFSFRINPTDMKNYSSSEREINTSNLFAINRLGLDNTLEEGQSLTVGIDFKKEKLAEINKFFELNIGTIFRDETEERIPTNSTINQKSSNIFGSSTFGIYENLKINYDFATDNDLQTFEYNSLGATFSLNKLVTNFDFVEKNGKMGSVNFLKNTTTFNFDDKNYFSFNTRRNRKINLTEYYDLVYEYKNDCLTAGVKYKKTYYEDRDLKPTEDLLFTITLIPITQYEQKIDQSIYRD